MRVLSSTTTCLVVSSLALSAPVHGFSPVASMPSASSSSSSKSRIMTTSRTAPSAAITTTTASSSATTRMMPLHMTSSVASFETNGGEDAPASVSPAVRPSAEEQAIAATSSTTSTSSASTNHPFSSMALAKSAGKLALVSGLGFLFTLWLSTTTNAYAGAMKLVYAGAIAGILSRTACAPIEMVSTVMMCRGDECTSMRAELAKVWKEEGLKGMFKGNAANCLKVAPSRGTQFLVYELVKRHMVRLSFGVAAAGTLSAGSRLVAGGMAGMVAAAMVYPLEVVKTMLTLYPEQCHSSIPGALKLVYQSNGLAGLYRGLGPTLVAMFPYVGVEFMVYETLKRQWELTMGPVSTLALLLLGAIGGAAAQASAHPLDVIRRRMQLQTSTKKTTYSNMFTGLYRVAKDEGVHVLFNGLGPACLEKIPSTAIGYFIYEGIKGVLKVTSV